MPKIQYVEHRLSPHALGIIQVANTIISEYDAQGFTLTLRQLYYQFVARGLIPNNLREYHKLGDIISKGRRAGKIDWLAIEDRTRFLRGREHFDDPANGLHVFKDRYSIDLWADQPNRVEVWIEKDALVGVIAGICDELDVRYFSCRGYCSDSEIWRAAMRFKSYEEGKGKSFKDLGQDCYVLHLGDHDPSGVDMTRDIQERLWLFNCKAHVIRCALNMDQVERYDPPPNPAKITDSRAAAYIAQHGNESWELDAINPTDLAELINFNVRQLMTEKKWKARQRLEKKHRGLIDKTSNKWDEVQSLVTKKRKTR